MLSEFRLGITNFIKSKNISNAAWSSFEAVIYPALMLVATPIFIQKLGVELYGIWMLVNTIVASIGILNIGLGDATIKFVSKYLALKDKDGVIKIISATYSLYLILAILVMAIGFVFAFLLKNFNLFHVSEAYMSVTCHTIQIAGVTLGLKFIEQIFLAVFKGYQRYDLAAKVSIIGKVITILVNLLLVYLGYSLIHIFISTCILTLVYLIIEGYLVYRFSGFVNFYPIFEKKYLKEIISFGLWTWILSVISILSGQIDKFLVVSLSDIKTFAYYSIAVTVFTQIHNFFSASASWIFPIVSKKMYENKPIDLLYFKAQFFFLSAVSVILILFYLIKDPFILLWLGPATFEKTKEFINPFILLNFIMAVTIIPYYFLNGSGYFKLNTIFNIINLIARLIFIPLLYYYFGNIGLVGGLIISTLTVVPFQINSFFKFVLKLNDNFSGIKAIIPFFLFSIPFFYFHFIIDIISLILILVSLKFIYPMKSVKDAL